jgi:S-adenosylmethionine:tRNA ribosyltransferase-isomerase
MQAGMQGHPPQKAMDHHFHIDDYNYQLPEELIAQHPATERDQSRLMVVDCPADRLEHRHFTDITDLLRAGDLLVVNNTKVFPARFFGHKETGGKVEVLLLHYPASKFQQSESKKEKKSQVTALLRTSKRPKPGSSIHVGEDLSFQIVDLLEDGKVLLQMHIPLDGTNSLDETLAKYGELPLPPYIKRPQGNRQEDTRRYQTSYADQTGSVAAPTAGLHFSTELLQEIQQRGVHLAPVTLHVGYGTFAPVRCNDIRNHRIHQEWISVSRKSATLINRTREEGGRVWAVGTTSARTLEYVYSRKGAVEAWEGLCDLYIYPGYRFKVVDNLLTNFHLPRSSLLFLVSAFAGRGRILGAYAEAVNRRYRFFSYGDAMALLQKT